MAYVALYRKWRPKTFEDVVGQRQITETLQKAIIMDKVAHAYLFSGPRGTGKTSTAKIFARAVNCEQGTKGHPCNTCEICRHIMRGESLDVVEIDAASNRSIEDIRTLRETVKFMPAEGKKKIYIIDEVHMLTIEAFNALLKTLEEPPAHVIFILATTEPERIPITILSRCQRYEFRRLTSDDIAARLLYVAAQEHLSLAADAARVLAVKAEGGMRDALSMLDQCVGTGATVLDADTVRNILGLIGMEWVFSFCRVLMDNDGREIIRKIDEIIHLGKEPTILLTACIEHLRALVLCRADANAAVLSSYGDMAPLLQEQAKRIQSGRLFDMLQILQETLWQAKTSPMPRIVVEMGMLRAAQPVPAAQSGTEPVSWGQRLQVLEEEVHRLRRQQVAGSENNVAALSPATENKEGVVESSAPVRVANTTVPLPSFGDTDSGTVAEVIPENKKTEEIPVLPEADTEEAATAPAADTFSYTDVFKQVETILKKEKMAAVSRCFACGTLFYLEEGQAVMTYNSPFHMEIVNGEKAGKCIEKAFSQVTGQVCRVQNFLAADPMLGEFEKKKQSLTGEASSSEMRDTGSSEFETEAAHWSAAAGVPAMDGETRALMEPLLKIVGECNIYREEKNKLN